MERKAIITLGNIFRKDDSIGCLLGKRIRKEIDVIDGGAGSLNLMSVISEYDAIVFIDAIEFGGNPGDVEVFDVNEINGERFVSTHAPGVREIVELSKILYGKPKDVVVIGIQPLDVSPGRGLSREMNKKLEEIIEKVEELLERIL